LDPDASQLAQLLWCQATAAGTGSKLLKPGEAAAAAVSTCFGKSTLHFGHGQKLMEIIAQVKSEFS